MTSNVNDPFAQNLVGLWEFAPSDTTADTGLADGIAQDGAFRDGASASGGQLRLENGKNDTERFEVIGNLGPNDVPFDLAEGTISVQFSQDEQIGRSPDTLVNRGEEDDRNTEGWFVIQVTKYSTVEVIHYSNGERIELETSKDFFTNADDASNGVGDVVKATYAWSETDGVTFVVQNLTTGRTETIGNSQTGLTMDIGDNDDEIFTFGAREETDGAYDQGFNGTIDYVAVYNVDTINSDPPNGAVDGEQSGEVMVLDYDDLNAPTDNGGDLITNDADLIFGNGGSDTIDGAGGNDTIFGDDGVSAVPAGTELLTNGSLEAGVPNNQSQYSGTVPGWQSSVGTIEIWGNGFQGVTASEGSNFIELDQGTALDNIYQDVSTEAGRTYELSFDGQQRGSDSDTVDVYWDNTLVASVQPGNSGWQTYTFNVVGNGDTMRLEFRERASENDSTSPFLDNISLVAGEAVAGDSNDVISGNDGDDEIFGEEGNDSLFGGAGDDSIDGGDGADLIDAGDDVSAGSDSLSGGADEDTFVNVGAGDTVDGGEAVTTGTDFDTLDLSGSVPAGGSFNIVYDTGNPENGVVNYFDQNNVAAGSLTFSNIENIVPCFTPGTLIATSRGECLVEQLKVGDRVVTRDNGFQEISWVGQCDMPAARLATAKHLRPIRIRAGALGNGLPERDMMVSPQHRILMVGGNTDLLFNESEVLVPAKHLTGMDGVESLDAQNTSYIHLMFEQHEVILSDGTWSESFQPGPQVMTSMGYKQRKEIVELFPELGTQGGLDAYKSARRSLKKHETRILLN